MADFERGRKIDDEVGRKQSWDTDDVDNDDEGYEVVKDEQTEGAAHDNAADDTVQEEHPDSRGTAARRKKQYAVSTRWERDEAEGRVEQDVNTYFCCCARRVGNMFFLVEQGDGSPIVVAGPCWPFCMGVTVPLIIGISSLVCAFIIFNPNSGLPSWVAAIYIPVLLFVLGALFMVSCRDPGMMERVTDEEAGEGGWFWNEQVGSYRPPKALYCRECGVLVQEYDHLCPWTGTGIGKGNMLAFKVFVVGVNVLCYLSLILVVIVLLSGLVQ
uniref:Palmitoyltransferase n=1 Tax=Grammatophora oceanica TaxID=210454 RepID=A0A7S1Y6N1_9STRA|mmetsp:Transcript_25771/g.37723  ORF Transcript_25771/g.37723 Transcript_25771/m.37723 type:complete len:271 (+) Transcript_25771:159-971(+)|eukprot:CAMPEP_0194047148 /NCGR_PEP_ID=MMETSP0009_2-20130614/23587_1 /TAXON_ID=210454 /ORGANISM="Grammatophora oceanica, Strain CCMP 410" /LENGTH=270 /DNA_ID=CAMNT_0038692675 /DNA_START=120 /DNA_END=932 /DNA_ORIENTATION=+